MTMSHDTRFLIAKVQASAGVAAAYTGSDLIPAMTLNHKMLEADRGTRDLVDGKAGASKDFLQRPRTIVEASVEAAGSGAAGTAPFYDPLLRACGFSAAITAGQKVTYTPIKVSEHATLVGGFGGTQGAPGSADDLLQEVLDAVGSLSFDAQEGELPKFSANLRGIYGAPVARDTIAANAPLDLGALQNALYRETKEVNFDNTAFSFAGQALKLRELNFADQAPVISADRPNELSTRRGRRNITGRMVVSAPALADFDYFAASINGATSVLSLVHGSGAGDIVEIAAPAVQSFLSDLGEDDNEVTATFDLVFTPSAGDDEVSILVR